MLRDFRLGPMSGAGTPTNQIPFRVRLVRVKDRSLIFFIMDLRLLLIQVRWGDALTSQDIALASEMSFWEVFKSSYLIAKTARIRTSRSMMRR